MKLRILKSLFLSLLFLAIFPSKVYAWKFAVAGDNKNRDYCGGACSNYRQIISEIIAKMPNNGRITILNTGDLTEHGSTNEWDIWEDSVAPLGIDWTKTNPPEYIAAVGNHDDDAGSGWQTRWADHLPAQRNLSAYSNIGITGNSYGLYGSVKYNNAVWIWVDSASRPSGQESFLEDTLQAASQDPEVTWKFVLFHHPPIPCGSKSDWETGKRWHDDYFVPYGVDIVFSGHAHYYERTCPFTSASSKTCDSSNRGAVIGDSPGVVHIITGGAGASLYNTGSCSWLEDKAKAHHFLEVEIQGNQLNLKTWQKGNLSSPIDEFTIQKGGGSTPTPTPTPTPAPTSTPPPQCPAGTSEEEYSFGGLSLSGQEVGHSAETTVSLSNDNLVEAYLSYDAYDIDCLDEGDVYLNGNKLADIPLTGENTSQAFTTEVNPDYLINGNNIVKFVFASNCGGTTGGYRIDGGSLRVCRGSCPSPSPGDVDGDCDVDKDDVLMVLTNWGGSSDGDANGDGKVNGVDFGYVVRDWNL